MLIRCPSFSSILRAMAFAVMVALGGEPLGAADQAPVVGPGATREEVINAYGWPNGFSQAGTKEILTYPQGRITLENGRVERVDFSTNVPWPPPRPRPPPPTASTAKKAEPPPDFWLAHFEDAQREARRRNVRILALFVGSDWSPPSREFLDEVAFNPQFADAFSRDFVLLRLDFPTRTAQPSEIREQNARLRADYEVTTYPSLLVLSQAGAMVATVDLAKARSGETYLARVIAAVREAQNLLPSQVPAPEPAPPAAESPATAPVGPPPAPAVASSVASAFKIASAAIAIGLLLAAVGWWFLWRPRRIDPGARVSQMAERISDAASGLPPVAEINGWSKERLMVIMARLAEADGYEVRRRGGGGDGDLALFHGGQATPGVVVACQPGGAGAASAKRLRELFGTITVEQVKTGWFVSPAGFSREARDYAAEQKLVLIDSEHLLAQMRAMPPLLLQKILVQ